jgi:hypothetical protein
MQFDLVCSGEARSMIEQPREQMAASGPSRHFAAPQQQRRFRSKADSALSAASSPRCSASTSPREAAPVGAGVKTDRPPELVT